MVSKWCVECQFFFVGRHCSACTRRRRDHPEVMAALRALESLERHHYGRRGHHLVTFAFVAQQLEVWSHRSALSGRMEHLRLRRFWPDRPLSECNCVVVTARENHRLSRHPHDWLALFPRQLITRMKKLRKTDKAIDAWEKQHAAVTGALSAEVLTGAA